MTRIFSWISRMFSDDYGNPSSTRCQTSSAFLVAAYLAIRAAHTATSIDLEVFTMLLAYSASVTTFNKLIERKFQKTE